MVFWRNAGSSNRNVKTDGLITKKEAAGEYGIGDSAPARKPEVVVKTRIERSGGKDEDLPGSELDKSNELPDSKDTGDKENTAGVAV
jgi:hypothetical protein